MNDSSDLSTSNPFSTRYVRPGAVPYLFPPGLDAPAMVRSLRDNRWQGQIVGPHGSGKSALLAALIPALEAVGQHVCLIELHDGQRRLPPEFPPPQTDASTLLVVDGYEQLSGWSRFQLRRRCRQQGLGLLVTTHRPARFPVLFRTRPDVALAQQIVDQLLGPDQRSITHQDVAAAFTTHKADLRETLFALYDLFERRRR